MHTYEELLDLIKNRENRYIYNRLELFNQIKSYFSHISDITDKEILQLFRMGLTDKIKCANCNNYVKMLSNGSFAKYCSSKCSANGKDTITKRKATNIEKYGVDNVFKSEKIKNKIVDTMVSKYGCHYTKTEKSRLKSSENNKNLDRNKISKSRYKNTFSKFDRFKHNIIPLFTIDEFIGGGYSNIYSWQCIRCNNNFSSWYHNGSQPKCPVCDKNTREIDLVNFISKLNVNIQHNNRTVLNNNFELDIYVASHNIAFEFNGNYWHSELNGCDRNYHLNKTKECKDKNIRLIHIFEDEYVSKNRIVKDRIMSLLNLKKWKIYARECTIREIDTSLKNKFLEKYHIQGKDSSSIKLGLFYKNRLISVMTFCKLRKCLGFTSQNNKWELSRFASIGKFSVIGGASKLLSHFKKNYEWEEIISYADLRWSEGNLYEKLNFTLDHVSKPNYWYVNKKNYLHRHHRFKFAKHNLYKLLENYDSELSEWENMKNNGYDRIWDCGNLVYKLENFK